VPYKAMGGWLLLPITIFWLIETPTGALRCPPSPLSQIDKLGHHLLQRRSKLMHLLRMISFQRGLQRRLAQTKLIILSPGQGPVPSQSDFIILFDSKNWFNGDGKNLFESKRFKCFASHGWWHYQFLVSY